MNFSIIIPLYNDSAHIARALLSVSKQSNDIDYECIVVNDMSTDGCDMIVEGLDGKVKNLTLVKTTTRKGPGGARNLGVKHATGDYIVFLDSDDWIEEDCLARLSEAIKDSPDIICIPYSVIDRTGKRETSREYKNIAEGITTGVGPWTKVIKRTKYVPMPESTLSEDTAWHFAQFDNCDTFACVSGKPIYTYDRTNNQAITDTVAWCHKSHTMEDLALNDLAVKSGKQDKWISDVIRNFANMYDVRHILKHPWAKKAWSVRFMKEYQNLMTGRYVH